MKNAVIQTNDAFHFTLAPHMDIYVKVKIYKTARRLKMRYDFTCHTIIISAPPHIQFTQIHSFLEREKNWIQNQILNAKVKGALTPVEEGCMIPIMGKDYILTHASEQRHGAWIDDDIGRFFVAGPKEHIKRRARDHLKKMAHQEICSYVAIYAEKLNVRNGRITIKDTRSRWGSCSIQGNLNFSWRLIMAPKEILAYVVAHEVAHLKEHNHSPAFWVQVARNDEKWQQHRAWLQQHGQRLFMLFN